jgi:iron complex outermembrane receptor protein
MVYVSRKVGCLLGVLAWAGSSGLAMAQPAGTSEQDGRSVGEIVVTAQRRSELARDVPISLTTLSGDQLLKAGVTDTRELMALTPGLKMDRIGGFTVPALRGITSTTAAPAQDNNVAIYVDGIYQPSVQAATFDLPDVERVEVLKGPQGTLFGRNATGGAIQIITRRPSYSPEGAATLRYGNYNDLTLNGFVSGPLVDDRVAFSLTGLYRRNDSYYQNVRPGGSLEGAETKLVRGKLRFDPTERLEIVLTAAYSERQESLAIYGSTLNGNTVAKLLDPASIVATQPYEVALNDQVRPQEIKSRDLSAHITYTTDHGAFTSITSYLKRDVRSVIDGDYAYSPSGAGVNYYATSFDEYFSQELSYASSLHGPINFSIGAYYSDGSGGLDPLGVESPTFAVSIFAKQKVKTVAGFGEVYLDVTDRLTLIGGLRYSWEQRSLDGALLAGLGLSRPSLPFVGEKSWDSFTPRASIKYALTPSSNVYFTYSQGFKSGAFNTNNVSSVDVANPEKVKAYEVGYKGRVGGKLTLDVAAFYYDYKDLQATISTAVDGVPLSFLRNAASARIYGLDVDATWRFSPYFDVRAAGTWLDAQYDDFSSASVNRPCTNIPSDGSPCSTVGAPLNVGNTTVPFDASGGQMVRAPKFSSSLTANAHVPVGEDEINFSSTLYYSSRFDFTIDRRISQPAFVTLDARLEWRRPALGLTVALFGKNLTDKATIAGTFVSDLADGISWSPPRTYGVELGYRF